MASTWTPQHLQKVSNQLENSTPQDIMDWGLETFGQNAVMGTGFGYSGVALMHMLSTVRPDATVFYLDTDLLFEETYELRDQLEERTGLNIVRVHSGVSLDQQKKEHGPELWNRDPDTCCFIRKVKPLQDYLADKKAWITAIRRDQSPTRANTDVVEWNEVNSVVKLNPLATWTADEVWAYIHAHDLPYNPLHDEGYPSLGCIPCTEPTTSEDERAGRWAGSSKTECGLHLEPQSA